MLQVVPESFVPKPTDDEIARVTAWQSLEGFQQVNRAAEAIINDPAMIHIMGFMGEVIDERFIKKALIGMIHYYARKNGVR